MTDKAETMLQWESKVQAKQLLFLCTPPLSTLKYVNDEQLIVLQENQVEICVYF